MLQPISSSFTCLCLWFSTVPPSTATCSEGGLGSPPPHPALHWWGSLPRGGQSTENNSLGLPRDIPDHKFQMLSLAISPCHDVQIEDAQQEENGDPNDSFQDGSLSTMGMIFLGLGEVILMIVTPRLWFDLQGYKKAMKKVHGKLDLYMQGFVEKHREKELKGDEEMEGFVDVLISQAEKNGEAIPDKDAFVKATAIAMFIAGTDTSSVCLEWALSLLLSHPHAMNMAQEKLDSEIGRNRLEEESDIPQLKYL